MEHPFEVAIVPDGASVTLSLAGELDIATADTLRACLDSVDSEFGTIVLDLAELRFLDSTGLAIFASLHARLEPQLRRLELRGARECVQRVLEISGLTEVIPTTGPAEMSPG